MKIGVYGGTFNPPHLGHLAAARTAVDKLGLDKLLLIPAAIPPHKELPNGTPAPEERLAMVKKMADALGMPKVVEVSSAELERAGRSYTSDTLSTLAEQYPDSELWLERKRNAVELMQMGSLRFGCWLEKNGESLESRKLNPDDYAPGGGGMPIVLKGTGVIGSVCVSGEPNHLDDQAIVTQALRQLKAEKEA